MSQLHCYKCNYENDYLIYTSITGSCSQNVTQIFLSESTIEKNILALSDNICAKASVDSGTFTISDTLALDFNKEYILWAAAEGPAELYITDIKFKTDKWCLSADTLITMADNSKKRLDQIVVGDLVMDENGLPTAVRSAHRGLFNNWHAFYYFEDGTVIHETHDHRFYNATQGFWQRLRLWDIGDCAINQQGEKVALVSTEFFEEDAEMFGIVTDSGTYYANGLLSGAASCNKSLLKEASVDQIVDMALSLDESKIIKLFELGEVLP